MDLVIDANVLFAAFIKDSTTRRLLLTRTPVPLKLYTAPFVLEEAYKYRKLLASKAAIKESEVMGLLLELIVAANIDMVNEEDLDAFKNNAIRISPRKNDAPYFAAALYKKCGLWSNDGPLKRQTSVTIINTKELLAMLDNIK